MFRDAPQEGVLLETPLGRVFLAASQRGLTRLDFLDEKTPVKSPTNSQAKTVLDQAIAQLKEYFGGQRQAFSVPLDLAGTDFQRSVWQQLTTIPFGETVSYLTVAQRIGKPKAMRAVGNANGRNPVAIIVPCHRVIAHGGGLGGYSSGLDRKRWLLRHEVA